MSRRGGATAPRMGGQRASGKCEWMAQDKRWMGGAQETAGAGIAWREGRGRAVWRCGRGRGGGVAVEKCRWADLRWTA